VSLYRGALYYLGLVTANDRVLSGKNFLKSNLLEVFFVINRLRALTKHENAKHDHEGMPMKIYKMKSFIKQITVEFIQQTVKKINNAIEGLQKMNPKDLYTSCSPTTNSLTGLLQ
jgi:predicted transcriptional regulator